MNQHPGALLPYVNIVYLLRPMQFVNKNCMSNVLFCFAACLSSRAICQWPATRARPTIHRKTASDWISIAVFSICSVDVRKYVALYAHVRPFNVHNSSWFHMSSNDRCYLNAMILRGGHKANVMHMKCNPTDGKAKFLLDFVLGSQKLNYSTTAAKLTIDTDESSRLSGSFSTFSKLLFQFWRRAAREHFAAPLRCPIIFK